MTSRITRWRGFAVAVFALVAIAACDETLDAGFGCPALCPGRPSDVRDTTIFPIAVDTSVVGYPTLGNESQLVLEVRGDTVDTRAVIRFDSLPTTFRHVNTIDDSAIVRIDSAAIKFTILASDTLGPPVTIELYDVDVPGNDTLPAVLVPAFTPARLLGSKTVPAAELKDSVEVPIDSAKLLAKVQAPTALERRLRVGVRITAPAPVRLTLGSQNGGLPALFHFNPDTASTVPAYLLTPRSLTPTDAPTVRLDLGDFSLVAKQPAAQSADAIRVGGPRGERAYLRFDIPSLILDSSTVVRATLQLAQRPTPDAPEAQDTGYVQIWELAIGGAVTDIARALLFIRPAGPEVATVSGRVRIDGDSAAIVPSMSGVHELEIIPTLRRWRFTDPARTPRVIILRGTDEGIRAWQADFFSNEAATALRPRLRLTYVPQEAPGLP